VLCELPCAAAIAPPPPATTSTAIELPTAALRPSMDVCFRSGRAHLQTLAGLPTDVEAPRKTPDAARRELINVRGVEDFQQFDLNSRRINLACEEIVRGPNFNFDDLVPRLPDLLA
jgi:hypothetical protein